MSDNWLAELERNKKLKEGMRSQLPGTLTRGGKNDRRSDIDKALDSALEKALAIKKEEA